MRAYERLLKYVQVWTTSDGASRKHPSADREFDLARMLVEELNAMGIKAEVDDKCYVYAVIPATPGYEDKKAIGFISHVDTVAEASGKDVHPVVHEKYDGKPIVLKGRTIDPEMFPFLKNMVGETIITADGTTLLGADDKAGVAEIMTMAERIMSSDFPHGKICIGFTPDEEIGEGADFFDIKKFGADYAYTVDGDDAGGIEYENFNAASASIHIEGFSVHPGSAKGVLVNASNVAMEYDSLIPKDERPENTEGREGFYHVSHISGETATADISYILRDHDWNKLTEKKEMMQKAADILNKKYGEGTATVKIRDSYRNMIEMIKPHFHLIENARKAVRAVGLEPIEKPVRGGTDGARLSWEGLPCPNLGTGGFNFHGEYELASAERMDKVVDILMNIIGLYAE